MIRRSLLLLVFSLGCRRAEQTPAPPAAPSLATSASVVPSIVPALVEPPAPSAPAHVALLEEVAAVHRKKLPCGEVESALAPLREKMKALGDVADPRLGAAIERDESLRKRRNEALEAIMDGAMRCRADAG